MSTDSSRSQGGSRRQRERDSFSDKEVAKMLGIPKTRLYRICNFFDSNSENEWKLIEGEHFEYKPGPAKKRRFYEEGVMAIAKYLDETEGESFLVCLKELLTRHRARLTRTQVKRRIVQVTQDRSALVIRDGMLFLLQRSVVRFLATNGKGMVNTIRRVEKESTGLKGAAGLKVGVHFDYFDNASGRRRYWSQRGVVLLARTMYEEGRIPKARKAWVGAVANVGESCFEVQRKQLESHEARVRSAKEHAHRKAKACAVTRQKPNAATDRPIELEAHHLFDAATRPDLAALDDNLLVITSALHRNFHHWMRMRNRPCEPQDFVDYLTHNQVAHFGGRTPRTRARQEKRFQKLVHRLRMLQVRYEGNRLLY